MAKHFQIIDTGIRPAREQIAFDQALVDAHKEGTIGDTLRFLQFRPTVLVGRHQALAREVNLTYCAEHGIEVGRRVTGGGAIYLDQGQLGWELVFRKQSLGGATLADVTQQICETVARAISSLGVQARYRPRSDIEVDGRKISGTGGFFDGNTLIYQGTLLIDMDPGQMVRALNIPQVKAPAEPGDRAEQRVVTLKELLPEVPELSVIKDALAASLAGHFGFTTAVAEIDGSLEALARRYHDEEIGTQEFVESIDDPASDPSVLTASRACPGGRLDAYVRVEGPGSGRIRQLLIAGDFFVAPGRTVLDLEAQLRGLPLAEVGDAVDRFFADASIDMMTVGADDFRQVIESALATAAPR